MDARRNGIKQALVARMLLRVQARAIIKDVATVTAIWRDTA